MPSIMLTRFPRLLRHCLVALETTAAASIIAILCGGWESHLSHLFSRSWKNFLTHVGTTGAGFFSPVIVSILCVLGTLMCIRFLQGKEAMLKHWRENAAITALVTIMVLLVVYGPQFTWQVARTIYDDHQVLVAANKTLPAKETKIAELTTKLTEQSFHPDRHLTHTQIEVLHDALRTVAQKYQHPSIVMGISLGDEESYRYFGELYLLFRDAGFNVPQQPMERLRWRKPGDPERFGSDQGLSIQVVMGDKTIEDAPRNHLAEDIVKAWGNSLRVPDEAISEFPTGKGGYLPVQKDLILWIGVKKIKEP